MCMVTDAELNEGGAPDIAGHYYFEATRALANTPIGLISIWWPKEGRLQIADRILTGLGLGASWGGYPFELIDHDPAFVEEFKDAGYGKKVPWITEWTDIAAFSAKCNATPAVQTTRVLKIDNNYAAGAVWADPKTFLGTVFYQGPNGANPDTAVPVQIKIDRQMVEEQGFSKWSTVRARIYGSDALPKGAPITPDLKPGKNTVDLTVSLKPGELLTLFSVIQTR